MPTRSPDHQHNADLFSCTWGNLNMMKGLAKGSLVSDSGIAGGWTWRGDANGGGVYSYDPDHSGSLSFQVEGANLLHRQLTTLWTADRAARNVVADLDITNNDSLERYTFHNARIQRPPGFALDTESPVKTWVLLYTGVLYVANIFTQHNVIGQGVIQDLPAEP